MGKRILIIQGHPDGASAHFCHALARAYAEGAGSAGHSVESVDVGLLDFPLLRSKAAWDSGAPPPALVGAQEALRNADHLVLFFPLWLGEMPALLKGFLEQVLRPGFIPVSGSSGKFGKPLHGRSARIVMTMGMPALVYRWYFRAHGLKVLKRNILGFLGASPVRDTVIGAIETIGPEARARWIGRLRALGRGAA